MKKYNDFNPSPEPEPTIEAQQETEKIRLQKYFEKIQSTEYHIYKDEQLREAFRKEVEFVCRHAFASRVDIMLFLDKSARGHRLLAYKILPVVRLEFGCKNNMATSQIKIPQVKFFNPDTHYEAAKLGRQQSSLETEEKLGPLFSKKKILIYDESSMGSMEEWPSGQIKNLPIQKQYHYFSDKERERFLENLNGPFGSRYNNNCFIITRQFGKLFPDAKFEPHIGASGIASGYDEAAKLRSEKPYKEKGVLWGIEDAFPEMFVGRRKPNKEDLEVIKRLGFQNLTEAQKQLRLELNMLAKESFQEIFAGK